MQIDVVFDTVCPWCYVGKRRFERALKMLDEPVLPAPRVDDPGVPPVVFDKKPTSDKSIAAVIIGAIIALFAIAGTWLIGGN